MFYQSKIYKSAEITPELFKKLNKGKDPCLSYGFFVIGDKLVPSSLIDRIEDHLSYFKFDSDTVREVEELLGEEFWDSLDSQERAVAGDCILIAIENGYTWEELHVGRSDELNYM